MNHQQAMSQSAGDHTDCQAELFYLRRSFHDDVQWSLYACPDCHAVIAAVGGGPHWWNYEVTNPRVLAEVADVQLA